jgi:stearoyl-CoA desaturase (Delta-9 desaturase)
MGTLGFQGSIRSTYCGSLVDDRWWVLRHRLHHRFTDTESDPYSADKGLFYSHVGWIFVKVEYPALKFVDKSDLDHDPVVRFQHRWFVVLAVFGGLLLPALVGQLWIGNWREGFIWGGIISRIAIWHCTYPYPHFCSDGLRFLINSLAHYIGEQYYTTEVTARGNFILALLTNGISRIPVLGDSFQVREIIIFIIHSQVTFVTDFERQIGIQRNG